MTKKDAQKILDCFEKLERNMIPINLINETYSLLPNVTEEAFQRVKIQAIRRFVVFNQEILQEALNEPEPKDIIVNDNLELNPETILNDVEQQLYEDDVVISEPQVKPKRKYTKRK